MNNEFYDNNLNVLDKQIKDCFEFKYGPGDLPVARNSKKVIKGLIVPHAGYMYSGYCSAWGYKEVGESRFPDVFVIIGANHSGNGSDFSTNFSDWVTPFGNVVVDRDLGRELMIKFPKLKNDLGYAENSIQVQLPFLQFVNKDKLDKLRILPIVIKNFTYEDCVDLADNLSDFTKNICVIASSDLTHYGPFYNYLPFIHSKKLNLYTKDNKILEYILNSKSKDFYNHQIKLPVCGSAPIVVCIEFCKAFGIPKCELLQYYTSGDIEGDYTNAVGYASIIFR